MPIGATYKIEGWPGEVISFNGRLATNVCPSCHIMHAFPEELDRRALEYNKGDYPNNYVNIHCPNGHAWCYTGNNSDLAKAKRALDETRKALAWTQDSLADVRQARNHAEAQARGYKGALVKTQKRIAAGVCPYCNRTFSDSRLARHIEAKHPHVQVVRS